MSELTQLKAMRDAVRRRLAIQSDFITWEVLNDTIRKLEGIQGGPLSNLPGSALGDLLAPSQRLKSTLADYLARAAAAPVAPSQANAAATVLEEAEAPLTSQELVPLVQKLGAVLGGKDPAVNLSSSLSRDSRFVTVKFGGRHCWWLAHRLLDGLAVSGDETATQGSPGEPQALPDDEVRS